MHKTFALANTEFFKTCYLRVRVTWTSLVNPFTREHDFFFPALRVIMWKTPVLMTLQSAA